MQSSSQNVTTNKQIPNADPEIFFKSIFIIVLWGNYMNFAVNSKSCVRIIMKIFFLVVGRLASNKPFDPRADSDLGPNPGICLTEFLPLWDRGNCNNVASNTINEDYILYSAQGSTSWTDVCALTNACLVQGYSKSCTIEFTG